MPPLSRPVRQRAAVGLLVAAVVLIASLTVLPVAARIGELSEQIENERLLLGRFVAMAALQDKLSEMQNAGRAASESGAYLKGESDAIRAASLQTFLSDLAGANGVRLNSTRPLPPRDRDELRLVGTRVQFIADIEQLREMLYSIEFDAALPVRRGRAGAARFRAGAARSRVRRAAGRAARRVRCPAAQEGVTAAMARISAGLSARPVAVGLAGACAILAFFTMYLLVTSVDTSPILPGAPLSGAGEQTGAGLVTPLDSKPVGEFRETVQRPLFNSTRKPVDRPKAKAEGPAEAGSHLDLRLVGIVKSGNGPARALIREGDQANGKWISEGDTFGGWKLRSVKDRSVIVEARRPRARADAAGGRAPHRRPGRRPRPRRQAALGIVASRTSAAPIRPGRMASGLAQLGAAGSGCSASLRASRGASSLRRTDASLLQIEAAGQAMLAVEHVGLDAVVEGEVAVRARHLLVVGVEDRRRRGDLARAARQCGDARIEGGHIAFQRLGRIALAVDRHEQNLELVARPGRARPARWTTRARWSGTRPGNA